MDFTGGSAPAEGLMKVTCYSPLLRWVCSLRWIMVFSSLSDRIREVSQMLPLGRCLHFGRVAHSGDLASLLLTRSPWASHSPALGLVPLGSGPDFPCSGFFLLFSPEVSGSPWGSLPHMSTCPLHSPGCPLLPQERMTGKPWLRGQ